MQVTTTATEGTQLTYLEKFYAQINETKDPIHNKLLK